MRNLIIKTIKGDVLSVLAVAISMSLFYGCSQEDKISSSISEEDRLQIEQIARNLPLVLTNEGWDAYESHFAQNYTNWDMITEKTRARDEFLSAIKSWYNKGNHATASKAKTIDFIPVNKDMVIYLRSQKEEFNDPNDTTTIRVLDMRTVSIYVREEGRWKSLFTAFTDAPQKGD